MAANGRGVFLDRDGILNELVVRDGQAVSPRALSDFRLRPDALRAVPQLRACGLQIFVVTNQPDIARGLLEPRTLDQMTGVLQSALDVEEVLICPHDDADHCECRKPNAGMLVALARRWDVDLSRSFVVGDSWKDMEAGRRAGCRTIFVGLQPEASVTPDAVVPDLDAAVATIRRYLCTDPRAQR